MFNLFCWKFNSLLVLTVQFLFFCIGVKKLTTWLLKFSKLWSEIALNQLVLKLLKNWFELINESKINNYLQNGIKYLTKKDLKNHTLILSFEKRIRKYQLAQVFKVVIKKLFSIFDWSFNHQSKAKSKIFNQQVRFSLWEVFVQLVV